ncbi:MAG TPA: response regulator, partial [bacterium]|nr:response regulator [bacterium]
MKSKFQVQSASMAGPFIPQRLLNPQTDSSLFVNARILIVDDDPAICDILSSYFRDLGVQCQSCRNSREAAELIRQNDFDAILSDIY